MNNHSRGKENMRLITVITPCYNEEENVREIYEQVKQVFAGEPN
jgi:cellulose synthase/poly-beta-1,6-N-acetylglucosamine synthase-like glycosyltransferase